MLDVVERDEFAVGVRGFGKVVVRRIGERDVEPVRRGDGLEFAVFIAQDKLLPCGKTAQLLLDPADPQGPSGRIAVRDQRLVAVGVLDPDQTAILLQAVAGAGGKGLEDELIVALIRDRCRCIAVVKREDAVFVQLVDKLAVLLYVIMPRSVAVRVFKIQRCGIAVYDREAFQRLRIVQSPPAAVTEVAADVIDVIHMRQRDRQRAVCNSPVR